ncbi:hypothetical protein [Flagellimonas crocea]|uniref:hypothetical protein n=1 Tax=Flagellimonas crocea TaxID=3067311 RepID=UPI00296EB3F2|nr:hypothetical protein [Muricauda sp. DH64]
MYRTKEIRWFFKEEKEQLSNWFQQLDGTSTHIRTDFYLNINNEDIGIKLREGKIEVKHRVGTRAYGCLSDNIWGCFDEYIKWSFNVQEQDSVLSKITDYQYCQWIPVTKEQKLVQLTEENGSIRTKSIAEDLLNGCQIEYSTIKIYDDEWQTLALEWFGDNYLKLDGTIVSKMEDSIKLNINESFGYANFLSKQYHNKSNDYPAKEGFHQ